MLKVYSKSDIGLVRSKNEDACDCGVIDNNIAWVIVCDGMGGANGGSTASNTAVHQISEQILSSFHTNGTDNSVKNLITSALFNANVTVFEMAMKNEDLKGMGTTAVVAVISDGIAHIAHAGDSRAYLINTTNGIQQLTTDHSMVQELVKNGDITEQEAKVHPHKNIITRALGVHSVLEPDYCEYPFEKGDILLVCTDGLTNYVDAEQIYQFSRECSPDCLAEKLVSYAKDGGGGDNITVAIVEN